MAFKMKGFPMQNVSAFKQKKTYPKSYTKKDIKFLEEQNEDIVRYEDLDEKGKAIWRKQGKPVPKSTNLKQKTKKVKVPKFDKSKGWKKGEAYTTDSGKKGHYVFDPKGKKYFMTSDGKLHTGQIDDL